jgi:hypothetical protein
MSEFLGGNDGWIDDPAAVEAVMNDLPFPVFSDIWTPIKDSGKGKRVLLYDFIRKASNGQYPKRKQTIGDCVAHGAAYAVDAVKSVDIILKNEFEEWVEETATEDIYAGSRVQIGGGRIRGDGSIGAWAARYVNEYGALPRGKYGNVDLTTYSGSKARSWGRGGAGVPKSLIPTAKKHPIQTVSKVTTYEEVRDLIANGYAVTIASMQGFSSKRDSEGFAKPQGSWAHQMSILAVDDEYKRPGVLVQNSWGTWNSGPKRHDQPNGSFWVDAEEIERRILKKGDSWAFSGYEGFKPRELNTRII